jgi:hypothetical protein
MLPNYPARHSRNQIGRTDINPMSSFLSLQGSVRDRGNLLQFVVERLTNETSSCQRPNESTGGKKIAASAPPPRNDKSGNWDKNAEARTGCHLQTCLEVRTYRGLIHLQTSLKVGPKRFCP